MMGQAEAATYGAIAGECEVEGLVFCDAIVM